MRDGVLFAPAMLTASRPAPCRGEQLLAIEPIRDVALAWRDGLITYAGPAAAIPQYVVLTLLACHAVTAGMRREDRVELESRGQIPDAARLGLADAVAV